MKFKIIIPNTIIYLPNGERVKLEGEFFETDDKETIKFLKNCVSVAAIKEDIKPKEGKDISQKRTYNRKKK
ncbi:MAG: hypothetical protein DRI01_00680 [Chloroflexi bacterium]|nr:MAG: hypothetical protein DRI01_00680 [Chloroflexota bacterium]